ncbi:GntR family transcriptional regulator [Erwinia sp. OLTSP20]|uniref:aminotransferase-like domain-containing protein n=1 Tax=unclassified Erwinia TaxID=2622719 RepID=UPI000C190BD2|nr:MULTISPECIES: PLP-dependent aminotransferase family protein [unclassified Erwinia]PIJ50304.1 GntR family transcriptional regulator [Erwinia sp. OAMSP11]PIJ72142.1 GntR family transcriptional regulator [Erwinia sp. OLSSP12]PIJ81433.1 GntR family transcriptional regulator [Erwinia sp. OLCASP19]PIJ84139.1 GntR family transcriptional regulator [Erwinia sp. OLMTSP26]PIJ85838.1 GntR family transcriptional regulator [Erwinia sp. OLMDSP33]
MSKYQTLVDKIRQQIASGIWLPGDKLPSLREQVARSNMSLMTVMHAYQVLESLGTLVSRPQSGYYVAPQAEYLRQPETHQKVQLAESVDINTFIFDVLQATRDPHILPFGSAFPDPSLFPQRALMRSLNTVAHNMKPEDALNNLPPGNEALRKTLAQRYAMQGIAVTPDEIVITNGAMEALNLSLQAVTEPGDWVVIENPCFYGALQAVERLRLRAVAIASDPRDGIDLEALRQALSRWPVKACWLMTNYQNPLGCTLSDKKKAQLVTLLEEKGAFLIEDDVYAELGTDGGHRHPARYWDRQGRVLHCSSFSKNLVAGFRVGWVAAGQHAAKIQRLQLMSTLSTSVPMQLALADYLSSNSYERHLRALRRSLAQRKMQAWRALRRWLPSGVNINDTLGGYFLWIELPPGVDAMQLYYRALAQNISIAPGKMFSSGDQYANYFRFNASWTWQAQQEQAAQILGQLIRNLMDQQ